MYIAALLLPQRSRGPLLQASHVFLSADKGMEDLCGPVHVTLVIDGAAVEGALEAVFKIDELGKLKLTGPEVNKASFGLWRKAWQWRRQDGIHIRLLLQVCPGGALPVYHSVGRGAMAGVTVDLCGNCCMWGRASRQAILVQPKVCGLALKGTVAAPGRGVGWSCFKIERAACSGA